MKFRKLRIAWSFVCGLAFLLLIVFWVRSYRHLDEVSCDPMDLNIASLRGQILLNHHFDEIISLGPYVPASFDAFGCKIAYCSSLVESTERDVRGIEIPLWSATLLSVALAACPWLRWRFGLRTLLIATTLVALVLGLTMYMNRH
jgi:hypothetical protein